MGEDALNTKRLEAPGSREAWWRRDMLLETKGGGMDEELWEGGPGEGNG